MVRKCSCCLATVSSPSLVVLVEQTTRFCSLVPMTESQRCWCSVQQFSFSCDEPVYLWSVPLRFIWVFHKFPGFCCILKLMSWTLNILYFPTCLTKHSTCSFILWGPSCQNSNSNLFIIDWKAECGSRKEKTTMQYMKTISHYWAAVRPLCRIHISTILRFTAAGQAGVECGLVGIMEMFLLHPIKHHL